MNLSKLQDSAAECTLCELSNNRVNPVFAKGNPFAKLMLCGMCPGPDENSIDNEMGWPFVGKAGRQLDDILEDAELTQKDVYITNMVKCYLKPGIRLKDDWINSCMSHFTGQVSVIEPKIILALGLDAGRALLNKPQSTTLDSMRGKRYKFTDNISIIVTYHPSYFAMAGGRKHKYYSRVLEDIAWVKEILNR